MTGSDQKGAMSDVEWTEAMLAATDEEMNAPGQEYVHFDEREDALASLELLAVIVPLVFARPQLWKWMILGAQSALQGAMVCALVDSTGTSVLKKDSAAKVLAYLHAEPGNRGKWPGEWLESFEGLMTKCESELGLKLSDEERKDILRLHSYFRNDFVHFTPKGWGIEKAGLPRMIQAAIDATENLMSMDRMGVYLEESQSRRFRAALSETRTGLDLFLQQLAKEAV